MSNVRNNQDAIPAIRFKGYTEAWEQRKLSTILSPSSEKNNNSRFSQNDILAASLGTELVKKHIFFGLKSTKNSIKNYRIVFHNDVIYTKSPIKGYPNGIIRTNKGKPGIVPSLYCVYHCSKFINAIFIQSYFEEKWRLNSYLYPLVNVGARNNVNITDLGFLEGNMIIPDKKVEQDKIVLFLEKLSYLIAANDRKGKILDDLKKVLLRRMFVSENASVPDIRFAGYTEDWEQRKLGALANIVRGASPRPIKDRKWFDEDSPIGWLRISDVTEQNGRIHHLEQHISSLGQEKTRVLKNQHLLLSIAATVGKPVMNYVATGVHDGFLIFLNPNFELEYMFQWLEFIRPNWGKYGQPGSQVNLNSDIVRKKIIFIPNSNEQKRISAILKKTDNLIAANERKGENLKKLKQSLMQKMFV